MNPVDQASLSEQKQGLRQRYLQVRRGLDESFRRQASQSICAHIAGWEVFQQAAVILTYLPIRGEVDLRPLLAEYPAKNWVIPRIIPEQDNRMVFHPYDPQQLVRHKFGMDEPSATLPVVEPGAVHLSLTPGLAFDRRGWRLGYGGGYFDRFLQHFKGNSLGVVYAALLLEALPHGLHDIPMGWLVTENGLLDAWA